MLKYHIAWLILVMLALLAVAVPRHGPAPRPVTAAPPIFDPPLPAPDEVLCKLPLLGAGATEALAPQADQPCEGGQAGGFACHNVDLLSFLPTASLVPPEVPGSRSLNDLWGWSHPETGAEYALVGLRKGTAFVNVTDPSAPTVEGVLPTALDQLQREPWRDIKVYRDHAFIVSETRPHGMQVVDLKRLPEVVQVAHYTGVGSAHNLAINEASGYAYATGGYPGDEPCAYGLHIIDIHEPTHPRYVTCYEEDGYIHDAQCVTYPADTPYAGREICFAMTISGGRLTILDVTDKGAIQKLSSVPYPTAGYTHQGWLTEDFHYFLLDDEADERNNGQPTTTYIWDVSDLTAPALVDTFNNGNAAIDHNLYVRGPIAYQSHYRAGLRLLDLREMAAVREVGYFDTYPADDATEYGGAWSAYPYLPSGNVLVSSIQEGLFVLRPTGEAAPPDFDLVALDQPPRLCAGQGATLRLDSHALHGYAGRLALSVAGTVPGLAATLAAHDVSAGEATTLTLTLDRTLPPGPYSLTLTASDGPTKRQLVLGLRVADCQWLPTVQQ